MYKIITAFLITLISTALLVAGYFFYSSSFSFGSSNPVLQIALGGTQTSTAPSRGQVLVGNASGTYSLMATSSLGITASEVDPIWVATSSNYLTTAIAAATYQTIGGGSWVTTTADYWLGTYNKGFFWATSSADYWLTLQSVSGFSTTSADYWDTTKNRWTSANATSSFNSLITPYSTQAYNSSTFLSLNTWFATSTQYLTTSSAASTYLTQSTASTDYLSLATWFATSTQYLTTSSASTLYGVLSLANSWSATNTFSGVSTTAFRLGSDYITDITGTNLRVSSGALTTAVSPAFTSISTDAGTAGSPAITLTSDTDTGLWSPTANTLALSTGGLERMRLDSAGRMGLNVSPSVTGAMFSVKGSSTNSIIAAYTSSSDPSFVILQGGAVGYGTASPGGMVEYYDADQMDVFWTVGGATPATERLVTVNGAVYFETATTTNDSGSYADLYYTNMFAAATTMRLIGSDGGVEMPQVYNDAISSNVRDLQIDDSGRLGYVVSSQKYKKNIEDITPEEVSFIDNLKVKKYDYKDESMGTEQIGLIAEEVAQICPKCVSYKRSETKVMKPSPSDPDKIIEQIEYGTTTEPETVNYSSPYIIASMIEKIQEQQEQINQLAERLDALEGQPLGSVKSKSLLRSIIDWIISLIK